MNKCYLIIIFMSYLIVSCVPSPTEWNKVEPCASAPDHAGRIYTYDGWIYLYSDGCGIHYREVKDKYHAWIC